MLSYVPEKQMFILIGKLNSFCIQKFKNLLTISRKFLWFFYSWLRYVRRLRRSWDHIQMCMCIIIIYITFLMRIEMWIGWCVYSVNKFVVFLFWFMSFSCCVLVVLVLCFWRGRALFLSCYNIQIVKWHTSPKWCWICYIYSFLIHLISK